MYSPFQTHGHIKLEEMCLIIQITIMESGFINLSSCTYAAFSGTDTGFDLPVWAHTVAMSSLKLPSTLLARSMLRDWSTYKDENT